MTEKISIERIHELLDADKLCREMRVDIHELVKHDGRTFREFSDILKNRYGRKMVTNKEMGEIIKAMMFIEKTYRNLEDESCELCRGLNHQKHPKLVCNCECHKRE